MPAHRIEQLLEHHAKLIKIMNDISETEGLSEDVICDTKVRDTLKELVELMRCEMFLMLDALDRAVFASPADVAQIRAITKKFGRELCKQP
ncbi:hypothetical protein [Oryzomonas rubra]|uniref:Uncharacterized protein n=1 Tax=Oryzomonas rubra TaxID=2509454 RepID=A0A5A9X6J1_9BACT|nr:hypothetical protein [Oryzomonas rubra]KAA0888068.1 hypothetical protein ET418_16850 [Oryzomonas rubra]